MQTDKAEKLNIQVLTALLGRKSELEFVEALRHYLLEHMERHLSVGRLEDYHEPGNPPLKEDYPRGDLSPLGMFFLAEPRNHNHEHLTLWGILRDGEWVQVKVRYQNTPRLFTPYQVKHQRLNNEELLKIATPCEIISCLCSRIISSDDHDGSISNVVDRRELSLKLAIGLADSLSLIKRIAEETFPDSKE